MNKYKKTFLLFLALINAIITLNCGEGISPETSISGFKGRITFLGTWPHDATMTHIVLFKNPLISSADFSADNINFVSDSIPFGVAYFDYNSDRKIFGNVEPGSYSYLAVVQSNAPFFLPVRNAWRVIGVYYANGDASKPGIINVKQNEFIEDINIICDYNAPPPQPPGGE